MVRGIQGYVSWHGLVSTVASLAIFGHTAPYFRVVQDRQLCRHLRGLRSVQEFSRGASRASLVGAQVVQLEGVSLLEHQVLGLEWQ